MLGKLLKYELMATGRQLVPAYLATLALSLLAQLFLRFNPLATFLGGFLASTFMFLFFLAIFGLAILTIVLIIQRFYSHMLKDEGYLAHTLPVSIDGHILAKLISATIWSITSAIVLFLNIFTVSFGQGFWTMIRQEVLPTLWALAQDYPSQAIISIFAILVFVVSSILHIYNALAIGQLANRRKILLSVGAYFGIDFAFSAVSTAILFVVGSNLLFLEPSHIGIVYSHNDYASFIGNVMNFVLIATIAPALMRIAVCYPLTRYLLKNKLNLE